MTATRRPAVAAPRPYRFPPFTRVGAEGGGTVLACHLPGRPLAAAVLVVDAGAVTEPAGKEGLALLTARMLGEGAGGLDAFSFALAAERLGASFHADAEFDSLRVGFDVPASELPEAVSLLGLAVREPALDPAAFERVRAERVDELAVEWSQPGPRAGAAFAAHLWAPGSRYSVRDGGDAGTVAALGRADVVEFLAGHVFPGRATLVVAGDLSGVDPGELAERLFRGWAPGADAGAPRDPARPAEPGRRVVLVDRPGSVQSTLLVGHPGPPRRIPDYVALTTFALAFGGVFRSRLNYRLREERGYTYGAYGGFELRRHAGVFAARAAVEASVSGAALADIVAEVERAHSGGLTGEELESVKGYRVGVLPVSFADPAPVARALGDLVVHGLPDDYFDRLRRDVAELDLEAVNETVAARLFPDRLVSVVVGDVDRFEVPAELGEQLRVDG